MYMSSCSCAITLIVFSLRGCDETVSVNIIPVCPCTETSKCDIGRGRSGDNSGVHGSDLLGPKSWVYDDEENLVYPSGETVRAEYIPCSGLWPSGPS